MPEISLLHKITSHLTKMTRVSNFIFIQKLSAASLKGARTHQHPSVITSHYGIVMGKTDFVLKLRAVLQNNPLEVSNPLI